MNLKMLVIGLCVTPLAAFAIYVAWLVTPIVVREVVPEVVRAVSLS